MGLALDAVLNALVGNFLILFKNYGERAPFKELTDYRLHIKEPTLISLWVSRESKALLLSPQLDKAVHWM